MKICVVGTRGFPLIQGGVEKHCQELYPLLEDAEIIVFRRKPYVKDPGNYKHIRFVDLPSTRIKGFEAVLHSFLSVIYAVCLKPDVVHFHNIGPALFSPIVKLFSIPVVLTYHSPNYEHKKWGVFAKKLLKLSECIALSCSDKIIFVNKFQREKFPEAVLQKSIYVPNGIDIPEQEKDENCLTQYGLVDEGYILTVGRITPEKGFHTLIEAFRGSGIRDKKLVIVGTMDNNSKYMEQLQELSKGLPVVFTGFVFGQTLAQLYSSAALYVLASENEGFPLVLLEAMSYGCNILASDIPATHLVCLAEHDYFPVNDAAALGKKLVAKLEEQPKRAYDLSDFTWKNVAEQTMSVFDEAYGRRKG